jgi:hypothetical protein
MNTHEKVTISAPKCKSTEPTLKVNHQVRPHCNRFIFKPKLFPQLYESVLDLNWNDVEKKIRFTIAETPRFEAYQWIKYLQSQTHEAEKSPFTDLDSNLVTLSFTDESSNAIANVRFRNLTVLDHNCNLSYAATEDTILKHFITLSYQYFEFVLPEAEQQEFSFSPKNSDEEWQSVSLA